MAYMTPISHRESTGILDAAIGERANMYWMLYADSSCSTTQGDQHTLCACIRQTLWQRPSPCIIRNNSRLSIDLAPDRVLNSSAGDFC